MKDVIVMSHKLFCILGESASGKTSLVERICESTGMTQVISYTTRPRRDGESDNHIFVNDDVYEEMKKNNQIAAYTQIGEYKYWSTIDQIYQSDIYVIDNIGVQSLRELNLQDIELCLIYINVPKAIRRERAIKRGDNMDTYARRAADEFEQFANMKIHNRYDYAVSNIDSAKASSIIRWIINTERIGTVQN
nr:MAG TPA: Guanylate kinase [Caudoviricetes sp.]